MTRAVAQVDHAAIAHNLGVVRAAAAGAEVIPVVKADAYGHGAVPVARTLRENDATWLGVALPSEALALRAAGDTGRVLAWLWAPGDPDLRACVENDVDLTASSTWALDEIAAAAAAVGRRARVHVKVDTGLTRNGLTAGELPDAIASLQRHSTTLEPVGLWSHLADGETPGSPTVAQQRARFTQALETWRAAGLPDDVVHLANSGAVFAHPDCHFTHVRSGIAIYGLSAGHDAAADLGLRPAMTLRARLAHVKRVSAGTRVSYGGIWTAGEETVLGLVPIGYADGLPRSASTRAHVRVGGRDCPIVGRIAMDQCVVDLGPSARDRVGDEVVVFGAQPTADDWGTWSDSIGYEVVTRLGPRVPREHLNRP